MFTGLIEEIGTVRESTPISGGKRLVIESSVVVGDLAIGDSVSVDGVCQTAVAVASRTFSCEAVGETLDKTTLGALQSGARVNLERAMRADTRMGGHMVQGHVSGLGYVTGVQRRGDNWLLLIDLPESLLPLMVPEGSVAVQGVSLTVAHISGREIGINVVPHTADHTNLVMHKSGDSVNIETDILGRYVARMLSAYTTGEGKLDISELAKWGYA
ncbi:MAG: riboflavin synthase [Spirochaetales bacterium]